MEKQVVKKMFELVNAVVFNKQLENSAQPFFEEGQLNKTCALARKHDLSHIVSHAILSNDLIKDNQKAITALTKEKLVAIYRSENIDYLIDVVTQRLEQAEVDFILLKGAVIRDLYPERWLRTSCDVDVLIKKKDVDKAISVLCNGDVFKKGKDSTLHDHALVSQSGITLELHYTLEQDGALPKTDQILNKAWDGAMLDGDYKHKHKFSHETFMFYHIAHMAKHFVHGGCGIRPFIDLKLLLDKFTFDKNELNNMLKKAHLHDFYQAVCALVKLWFDSECVEQANSDIEQFVLTGGVYGTHKNNAMVSASKGKGKMATFFSVLYLPKKNLEVIYPRLKKYPILFPFYQIKRWFRIFKKDKVKRVKTMVDARSSVSNVEIDTTTKLLQRLGLSE